MNKKAIIYDLDNTIYPVSSIAETLFMPLLQLLKENGTGSEKLERVKDGIMRKPFQIVAAEHHFSDDLTQKGINLLKGLTYTGDIRPFSDYSETKNIPGQRFLVTMGFLDLQLSKIRRMGIEKDFTEIYIIDPTVSAKTKMDIFSEIMEKHGYKASEVLVVGDDPESEIRAARELGIDSVLYDKHVLHGAAVSTYAISDFAELRKITAETQRR